MLDNLLSLLDRTMSNEISQEGFGNIALQSLTNSPINISIQLGKSTEYSELLSQLNILNELEKLTPVEDSDKKLAVSKKISDIENLITLFKQEVLDLAETFNRVEANSERLSRAKKFFDNGEIGQARDVLSAESVQMKNEQIQLLKRRDEVEEEISAKLKNNSEEFLVLALTMSSDYKNPNRFTETCQHFESSVESFEDKDNLFAYGHFLSLHNNFIKAKEYFEKCLNKFESEMTTGEKVDILNNIALTYGSFNEFEQSQLTFEKALKLAIDAEAQNPTDDNKSTLAYILSNYGLLLRNAEKNEEAEANLRKALEIREELFKLESFESQNNVAVTSLNLGLTYLNKGNYQEAGDCYIKSLNIYENIREVNLYYSLQQMTLVSNNLGDLYERTEKYDLAEEHFTRALDISIRLLTIEPQQEAPTTVLILSNLASFYQRIRPKKEESILYAIDALTFALPIVNEVAMVAEQFYKSRIVLQNWGMNDEQIEAAIDARVKFLNQEENY